MKRGLIVIIFLFSIFNVLADSTEIDFSNIPTLNLTTGINKELIDLDDYYNGTALEYKFKAGSKGLEGIQIAINSDGEVDMTANSPGERSVIFIADNDTDDRESNDVELTISGDAIVVPQSSSHDFFPVESSISVSVGEKKTFTVSGENVTAEWFLNGLKLPENDGSFEFDAAFEGDNTIKVVVGSQEKIWTVVVGSVSSPVSSNVTSPEVVDSNGSIETPETVGSGSESSQVEVKRIAQCGNSVKEKGENCGNCPSDVRCSSGSKCSNNICVRDDGGVGSTVIMFGVLGVVLIGLVGGIVFAKKKGLLDKLNFDFLKKKDEEPKEEKEEKKGFMDKIKGIFSKKKTEEKPSSKEEVKEEKSVEKKEEKPEEDLSGLKSYLFDNLKKGFKKEDLIKQALGQGWKQNQIDKVLEVKEELKPLYNYINDNLKKGFKKEDLVKQALGQGWKQEEVDEVASKL
ncbi:MAG: hypothetical protein CMH64_03730 [Nanoarchaeota archaeon]|nr:hypothetical protein [Nanoarchaeota archaeon]|tara:strand:+ start:456 stop:1832 length:1377 start_codon:yes stop_codon:yes gene_type:complete